jgi:RNA polymerase sigma factor (sigma-70 family)
VTARLGREALAVAAEAAVVVLAAAGDDRAFEELVRRRQGALRALLRRLSGNAALADDLAQQCFVQAWSRLKSLRAPGAFGGWLRQIAIRTWLAQSRLNSPRLEEFDVDAQDPAAPDPSLALDLDRLLGRLSEAERTCIVLAYAEGLTHAEIAAATGWPLGTVKSHVLRGSARLRQWWTDGPG